MVLETVNNIRYKGLFNGVLGDLSSGWVFVEFLEVVLFGLLGISWIDLDCPKNNMFV